MVSNMSLQAASENNGAVFVVAWTVENAATTSAIAMCTFWKGAI
eukprot:CAMPEP_0171089380 /NCGR_PEP_ID=MMETSP0766_2-20121228/24576_1 /TAXON_ID=439317 /ORGANISM="Gambierdiscus australes, Strain CAWD 149" /LENGTH=43 /DNA_ID= /DNA_START= /DNA_END= /DNA_ORIENTATION=